MVLSEAAQQSAAKRDGPRSPMFPQSLFHPLGPVFARLPISLRRHLLYLVAYRRWGNFRKPILWSEKMQWRILNDRRMFMAIASDKLASKRYVQGIARRMDLSVRIPATLWVGSDIRELHVLRQSLPPRWVFKPNSSSGRVRLVDSSTATPDWGDLGRCAERWMKPDEQVRSLGHWGNGRARRTLLAEERVGVGYGPPADLRAQVFGGQIVQIDWSIGMGTPEHRVASYAGDMSTRMHTYLVDDYPAEWSTPIDALSEPQRADLKRTIETIAGSADYLRVDGYFVDGQYWFGELTPYAWSGIGPIGIELDRLAGSAWKLPQLAVEDLHHDEMLTLLEITERGILQVRR